MKLKLIVALLAIPLSLLLMGYVSLDLYTMFLVPLGLPEIGYALALGATFAVRYIFGASDLVAMMTPKNADFTEASVRAFTIPVAALLLGNLIHLFV